MASSGRFTSSFLLMQQQDRDPCDFVEKTGPADFETAVAFARYGKFQRILLCVSGAVYASCAISTTTLSFVLPSAECDFNLSSVDKGKLSAMPLIGMIIGCGIWGYLADAKGRKLAIILALLVDFLAAFISSFAQNFTLFLICRFFNGLGIIGAISLVFSYLGEFLSAKHRDVMLGRLEIFWNIGMVLLPGLAWSLLSKDMLKAFAQLGSSFSPWRVFVLVCSLPSILSVVMMYFLPETPKYLLAKGQHNSAKEVFQKMFAMNSGQPSCYYPVYILEGEYENNNEESFYNKMPLKHRVHDKLKNIYGMGKSLFSQPYLRFLVICSFADFCLMASYYTLMMWFPEIFERFDHYEKAHPNQTASVCIVSQQTISFDDPSCDASINNRVFLDTIIIGLSCIPTSVSLGYFMKSLGKKTVLISCLVLSGLTTLSLNWVQNATHTLVLSCVFEALTSILEAVLFCVVVDLFPTNLRAVAVAITATSGRLGAIFGNVVFGLLIDLNCIVPIYLFGIMLIASGLLCLGIPESDNYLVIQ